jgi:hypothetical protein
VILRKALETCPKSDGRVNSWNTIVQEVKGKGIEKAHVDGIQVSVVQLFPV